MRAKRIKSYEDRFFKDIFDKQAGDLPYPSTKDQMRGLQGQIKVLEQKIGALQMPVGEMRKETRRPEVEALIADGKGEQPDAPLMLKPIKMPRPVWIGFWRRRLVTKVYPGPFILVTDFSSL